MKCATKRAPRNDLIIGFPPFSLFLSRGVRLQEEPEVVILDDDDEEDEPKKEPTHYKQLDVKKLKVPELRTELQARDLPTDGRYT